MEDQVASTTSLATSRMRAIHTRRDPQPILHDPWGDRLVPATLLVASFSPPAAQSNSGSTSEDAEDALETITDDFCKGGSAGVRPALQSEIFLRLGSGEHTRRASLIVCGHTHVPRLVQAYSPDDGHPITIVNAGSVGLPGYDDIHPHKHWIETGSPHARYALIEQTALGWNVQLRSVAYDFEPMAQLAEQRGRPDWALPLRTGRMSV